MFVVTVTYLKPLVEVEVHLAAHREFLKSGYQKNLLLASGPQNPRVGGIILARGGDRQGLLDFLAQDPFHLNGIARYDIVEFEPVLSAEGMNSFL